MHRLAIVLGVAAVLLAGRVNAADQVSHYVDYQVELRNLPAGASGDGTWQMGAVAACSGWKVTQIANLNLTANGRSASVVITQQADETVDGLTGKYDTQISAGGQQIAIKADVKFPRASGDGTMTETIGGKNVSHVLPAGTLLLIKASQAMLDKLAAGDTDFVIKAVEPTAPEGVAELRVQVIKDAPFSDSKLPADPDGAFKGKSWIIKLIKQQPNGAQQTIMQLYESGVIARILAQLSGINFEMTARTVKIFPKPSC